MFSGLSALFTALRRLTTSINTSADLFDQANERMKVLLCVDVEEVPLIEHQPEEKKPRKK